MNEDVVNTENDLKVFADLYQQIIHSPDVLIYKKEGLNNV